MLMTLRVLAFLFLVFALPAELAYGQQQPSAPAQMGLSADDMLKVLDSSHTWTPLGYVDPMSHTFTPVGGGGGGGGPGTSYDATIYSTHGALKNGIGSSRREGTAKAKTTGTLHQQGFNFSGDGGWADYDWNANSYCPGGTASAPKTADGVFCLLPGGQSASTAGRYLLRIPASGIHPEAAGAYCDTGLGAVPTHDDQAALQNLVNYISNNGAGLGTVVQNSMAIGACAIHSGSVTVPQGVKLEGVGMPFMRRYSPSTLWRPFIQVNPQCPPPNPATDPVCPGRLSLGTGSALSNVLVWREGYTVPATLEADLVNQQTLFNETPLTNPNDISVGVLIDKANDVRIDKLFVVGFGQCALSRTNTPRLLIHDFVGDCGGIFDISGTGDVDDFQNFRGNAMTTRGLDHHKSVISATVVSGGAGYAVNNVLSIANPAAIGQAMGASGCSGGSPAGCSVTPASFKVTSVGPGQAITGLSINDSGDTLEDYGPQDWGVRSATIVSGGSGGPADNTYTLAWGGNNTCNIQPQVSGQITSGVLTAVNVTNPGVCYRRNIGSTIQVTLTAPAPLKGAIVNFNWGPNPIPLQGGSGSGATVTVTLMDGSTRPGIGLFVHEGCDGCVFRNVQFEAYHIGLRFQNFSFGKIDFYGAEGKSPDLNEIGVDLEGCIKGDMFYRGLVTGGEKYGYLLNNTVSPSAPVGDGAGNCVNTSGAADLIMFGVETALNAGVTASGIKTGPGSYGTIIGLNGSKDIFGQAHFIDVGAGSGQWEFDNINWTASPGLPPTSFNSWIHVDPGAYPPQSPEFEWSGQGSLLANGDFVLDQYSEKTLQSATGNNAPLRADRWRYISAGGLLTSQILNSTPGNGTPGNSLQMTVSTPATLTSGTVARLENAIENGALPTSMQWGDPINAQPLTVDFWAKCSVAGTYDFALHSTGHSTSLVHRFGLAAGAWTYVAFVAPGNPLIAPTTSLGVDALYAGFDLGAGSTYQTSAANADQWINGDIEEITGDAQFAAQAATTSNCSYSAVHMRPGPFMGAYFPADNAAEFARAQRFFAKSFSAGQAVAQNTGAQQGAATAITPFATGSASLSIPVTFPQAMAKIPTVSFFSTNLATSNCYDWTRGIDAGAATALNVGTKGFTIVCALTGTGILAGDQIQVHWAADTGL